MRESYVVDKETGEYVTEIKKGDRIIRAKTDEYLDDTQEWQLEHFIKGNIKELNMIMQELSTNEKAFLLSIAQYIGYEDCCLKYSNGNDITTDDIVKIVGMGRSTAFETINSLIKKDILYKGRNSKNRQYFVNPWLFCKGNRINRVLKTMFQNYRIRSMGNKKWKDI